MAYLATSRRYGPFRRSKPPARGAVLRRSQAKLDPAGGPCVEREGGRPPSVAPSRSGGARASVHCCTFRRPCHD